MSSCSSFLSDVWHKDLVELLLEVPVSQVSQRQRDMLLRQVGVLLGVLDGDIIVREISAFNERRSDAIFNFFCLRSETHSLNSSSSSAPGWCSWCRAVRTDLLCRVAAWRSAFETNCANRRTTS